MTENRLTFNKLFKTLENYDEVVKFLNALHAENIESHIQNDFLKDENEQLKQENKEIKQLIHTMLTQIGVEKIGTEDVRYSARIIFTSKEFEKIRQIWKDDMND